MGKSPTGMLRGEIMFGLEKIEKLEKMVNQLNERINDLDAEVNVLRNELKRSKK